MDKCQKCQKEIDNNSYTLQKQGTNQIEVCATCFKNNKTTYMKEYDKVFKGNRAVKVPKPIIDGEETNFFECKKCHGVYDYGNEPAEMFEKGCPNCQSKDFEMKISLWNGILHYKIKECSKCHKMDMNDLIKWPDTDELKGKSKTEVIKLIKQENLNNADNCQCSHQEDNNNDRENNLSRSSRGFDWKSPWVIGGGIVILVIVGIVIYFLTRRKKQNTSAYNGSWKKTN